MATKLLLRLADTVGDGSGTKAATGDYDGSPTIFKVQAQAGEHLSIERMIVRMKAGGFSNSDQYGSGAALTNGVVLYVTDDNGDIQYYLTDEDTPVKTNGGWAHQCYDFSVFDTSFGAGEEYAAARWTFARTGRPVELLPGWAINVLLQDDLTVGTSGLTQHEFMMQGYYKLPRIGGDDGHA